MADDILPLLGYREGRSSDSDEDEPTVTTNGSASDLASDVSYDASLPAQHTYLGTDLEELSGRTMLEDDTFLRLPLLSLPGVVLIPGQTLPLHLFQPATVSMIKNIIENDRTFGMVNARYAGQNFTPVLSPIGTTAEIRSYKEEIDERSGLGTIRVKAEGRQRFQIFETRRQSDGILSGRVKMLPEYDMNDALEGARLPCTLRFLCQPPKVKGRTLRLENNDGTYVLKSSASRKIYNRFGAANFTWWPAWVYKQYDKDILMARIRQELIGWNTALKLDTMPHRASEFSYWVAANLPLDDTLRLNILGINCAIQRLRCELSILERYTVLCCKDCGIEITDKNEIFSMSVEGPQTIFVNPVGYVHETLTVYRARGLTSHGTPSTEYSWFPGYAWTAIHCRSCGNHMGWKFTTTDSKLKPDKFWGLCRSSLQPGIKNVDSEGYDWVPCL